MAPNRRKSKASSAAAAAKRQWKVGDLVLAKVKGFPAWPAVVSDPTKWGYAADWKKVMVFFYGTSQIAFCNPADVESFTEEKKESLLGKRHGKGADYVRAVKEIIDSYEGLVKNNVLDDSNAVDEVVPATAGNLGDSLASSRLKDQTESSQATFVSQLNGDDAMDKDGVSSPAEDAVANASHGRETSSEEPTDNIVMAEAALTTIYSTRKRSGSIQQNSQLKKRRDLRSRSSLKSHNLVVSSNEASKNVKGITFNEVQDAIVGMDRLIKGSPAASDSHVASSPADISTGSIEDNGFEIVTVDSDYPSLTDGSTFEFGKNLEHGEGEQEFGKQPDFQIKAHVVKKKRKPNRKRVASDAWAVVDEVNDEDVEIDISEEKLPNVCDKSDISICKEDGDEHLPLVKRARVRMGKHAAIEEKLDHFMKMEENSKKNGPVHTSSNCARDSLVEKESPTVKDNVVKSSPSITCLHLPEFSTKNGPVNEPVQTSSNRAQDSFVDKESLMVKDNVVKSSPSTCLHLPETSTNNGPVNEPVHTSSNCARDSFVEKESLTVKDNVVKSSPSSTCLHLPEFSTKNGPVNEPVHTSSNPQDSFVDKESLMVKNNLVDSASLNTCHHLSENSILGCESRKNQAFGSLDGEAALPPSKRLHRALEAMSANVAEDDLVCAQTPLNNGCCVSPIECHHESSGSKSENTLEKHFVECNGQFASKTDSAQFSVDVNLLVLDESKSYSIDVEPNETSETSRGQCEIAQSVVIPYIANKVSPSLDERNDTYRNNQDSVDQLSSKTEEKSEIMSSSPNKAELPTKNAETTECSTMSIDHISEANVIKGSPQNGASVHIFYEEGSCCDNTQSWKIPLDGGSQTAAMCQTVRETSDKSSQVAEKVLTPISGANNSYDSASISDDVLSVKDVTGIQSSSSTADRASVPARDSPSFNSLYHSAKTGFNNVVQNNGCGSPAIKLHEERRKTARSLDVNEEKADSAVTSVGKSHADTAACLTSFETLLGGLTRAKESIGRATRIAIDCAKYGASPKVLNILARHMENEPSLSKRVDFFFLVDSITQCSRGLKGDVHGAFASAVQSVLPRLLAAAAPPGNTARENRRQCLKVLRLWMERKTLPESIVQHHMRHLDSLNWSACPGAASRRPLRNERAFDDPLREMEGMLVDEYGSNSSLQLQGLSMPHMLKVEDDGSDSDGGSFEAVTPEHNSETPEVQEPTPTVGKYKHILEDVDGELEMEDVAPSCETVTSTFNEVSMAHTPNPKQYIPSSLPPPLPNDIPPSSPPLPTSPPPLPPPPPPLPHPPSAFPGTYTNSADAKHYLGTNNMLGNVPGVPHEPMNYNIPECQNYRMDTRLPDSSATCSFGNFDGSHVPTGRLNNVPQTDGEVMHNKACHLPPPPPPSNHFSYAHADPQVHSWRDAPYPHYSNSHHFPPNMDGAYYTDHDRSSVREFNDRPNPREFIDRPNPREFNGRSNPREFHDRSNPREFIDRSNPREFIDRSNPHEFNERSSSHEFNERWRYNEPSFSDPYYPHDRARGPPAPHPHFQGDPYRTRNQGWSHHSPEMRYRNAMAVRPPCEDNRYWGPR